MLLLLREEPRGISEDLVGERKEARHVGARGMGKGRIWIRSPPDPIFLRQGANQPLLGKSFVAF